MLNEKIRIRLKAYDYRILDQSTGDESADTAKRTGATGGGDAIPTAPPHQRTAGR